ncbi:MAG TPA: hypothetical protein VL625_08120 [Patescibacteria group bacterium]|nr:hypothetical protein [Patescibacteria group bacterium]
MRWPVAILDIGSNSVRLVVYDRRNPGKAYFNEKVGCMLGRDLVKTGRLNPEGKKKARHAIAGFVELARAMGAPTVHAIATAAIRDAKDGRAFVKSLRKKINTPIRIISGNQEAYYSALAVLSCNPKADGVVADLGGGSLELARVNRGRVHETMSLPLGVLRMAGFGRGVARMIDEYLEVVPDEMGEDKPLYAAGGTCRAIAVVHSQLKKDGDKIKGYSMTRSQLLKLRKEMLKLRAEEIMREYNIEIGRARALPDACLLLAQAMKRLDSSKLIITTRSLRDGYLYSLMHRKAARR